MNQNNEFDILSPARSAELKPVKVIAISGGKGGIGKTNIALNLSIALSQLKQQVLLLDADLALSNVDVLLGIKVRRNLQDVLSGRAQLEDIIIRGPHGVLIAPATTGISAMAELSLTEQASIIHAFSTLRYDVDVMLIDTAAGISASVLNFTHAAQEVVVVVCNEPTSITDAYALIKVLSRQYGIQQFQILSNMTHQSDEGKMIYNKLRKVSDEFLQVSLQYLGAIPYDDHVRLAVRHQRPFLDEFPTCRAALALRHIAKQIYDWKTPLNATGRMSFFFERLLQTGTQVVR
ncbi:MAG: P-loop NTPase [Legionellales bacterium]|nr:P-loop NTPase [Legionellales bacterium]